MIIFNTRRATSIDFDNNLVLSPICCPHCKHKYYTILKISGTITTSKTAPPLIHIIKSHCLKCKEEIEWIEIQDWFV